MASAVARLGDKIALKATPDSIAASLHQFGTTLTSVVENDSILALEIRRTQDALKDCWSEHHQSLSENAVAIARLGADVSTITRENQEMRQALDGISGKALEQLRTQVSSLLDEQHHQNSCMVNMQGVVNTFATDLLGKASMAELAQFKSELAEQEQLGSDDRRAEQQRLEKRVVETLAGLAGLHVIAEEFSSFRDEHNELRRNLGSVRGVAMGASELGEKLRADVAELRGRPQADLKLKRDVEVLTARFDRELLAEIQRVKSSVDTLDARMQDAVEGLQSELPRKADISALQKLEAQMSVVGEMRTVISQQATKLAELAAGKIAEPSKKKNLQEEIARRSAAIMSEFDQSGWDSFSNRSSSIGSPGGRARADTMPASTEGAAPVPAASVHRVKPARSPSFRGSISELSPDRAVDTTASAQPQMMRRVEVAVAVSGSSDGGSVSSDPSPVKYSETFPE